MSLSVQMRRPTIIVNDDAGIVARGLELLVGYAASASDRDRAEAAAVAAEASAAVAEAAAASVSQLPPVTAVYVRDGGSTPLTLPYVATSKEYVTLNNHGQTIQRQFFTITGGTSLALVDEGGSPIDWPRDSLLEVQIQRTNSLDIIDGPSFAVESDLTASSGETVISGSYVNTLFRYHVLAGSGAYTRDIVLPLTATAGAVVDFILRFDATANPTVRIRNGSGGTILDEITNVAAYAGSIRLSYGFDGAAWLTRHAYIMAGAPA